MCRGALFGPPHGIPIPSEIHEQFPKRVKEAWNTFDEWWKSVEKPASKATMPKKVGNAMQIILNAPIPGHEGATGADSCYIAGVQMQMTD